jgi:hypothetical protein
MRGRAFSRRVADPNPAGSVERAALTVGALVFLRGPDADAKLRELDAARRAMRPVLGTLAGAFVARRAAHALGYRSLGDYARERIGVGARCLREWARVWRELEALPRLRRGVVEGEIGWEVARRVVGLATPETETECLEAVRGRTVRAVEAIVAAVRAGERAARAGFVETGIDRSDGAAPEREVVRVACTQREIVLWRAARELARRVAGEELPAWECTERIAAEAASAMGAEGSGSARPKSRDAAERPRSGGAAEVRETRGVDEHGLRGVAFPGLRWRTAPTRLPQGVSALLAALEDASPRDLDRRLRAAVAFLQTVDLEAGRILRQMCDRRLFAEVGFPGLARYAEERLDMSPRTARRLVAMARSEHRTPEVATAFRRGRLHGLHVQLLARVAHAGNAHRWVERARQVTVRRLEEDVEARERGTAIAFRAPPEVAALFRAMLARAGSLERLLAHAIRTWVEAGARFRDYADFGRDGFRCTVPGCTARRNLHSHHVRFRSAGGADEPWNRTTLCAHHHQRGVHGGTLRIRGQAPDALVYALGPVPAERFRSGDVRMEA